MRVLASSHGPRATAEHRSGSRAGYGQYSVPAARAVGPACAMLAGWLTSVALAGGGHTTCSLAEDAAVEGIVVVQLDDTAS